MEIIIYLTIFIIGTLLGSFFSLAIYRIPLKQDITHKRSYCPKCNHKLGFWDMIPILSYIFLGAKCRYCKNKIRPRYLYLEIFSGILFLLFGLSLKINIFYLEINKLAYLIFGMFYISTLFIIGGIEKENHSISKPVLIFGFIIEAIYIIYLYAVNIITYKYVICLVFILAIALINTILFNFNNKKETYIIQILNLCIYFAIATKEKVTILSIILTLIIVAIQKINNNSKNDKKNNTLIKEINIPIGFYLCFANILGLIVYNFLN